MERHYLVTNIKFECDENFIIDIPQEYSRIAAFSHTYLRTYFFEHINLSFDYKDIKDIAGGFKYSTELAAEQYFDIDIVDRKYDINDKCLVIPMHTNSATVVIEDNLLTDYLTVEHLIFEEFIRWLPINFIVSIVKEYQN